MTAVDKRFYPGIGIPAVQLIGPGTIPTPVDALDAPEGMEAPTPLEEEKGMLATKRTRSPHVTGSFDHAVLPMPPVGLSGIVEPCVTNYPRHSSAGR
jgi:hypothetical protein